MYYKLTFLVFVLFIASCKKEEAPEPTVQYDIYVNDWNPDLVSTGAIVNFDLDGDGQRDIAFSALEQTLWNDSSGYDVYDRARYEILEIVDFSFKIATYNDTVNSNLFVQNELINSFSRWESGLTLYGKRWWDHSNSNSNVEFYYNPYEINNGEGYLALKREVNGDVYYGWIHLNVQPDQVTFYESGFNQIPNVPIRIGQTE